MTYKIKNKTRRPMVVNLPDENGQLKKAGYLPPRGEAVISEEEFRSPDVQAKVRQGVLRYSYV